MHFVCLLLMILEPLMHIFPIPPDPSTNGNDGPMLVRFYLSYSQHSIYTDMALVLTLKTYLPVLFVLKHYSDY